jgi:hypothetical protein
VLAGHCNGHMLGADGFVVGGIKAEPAPAGDIDFGPGVGGAVLAFTHLDIASDKSCPKTPMARGFHHEHRIVSAGPGTQKERPARKLDAGLLAANVFEGFVDMRIQVVQEFRSLNELTGSVKVQEPVLHGRPVMRIAWETVLDDSVKVKMAMEFPSMSRSQRTLAFGSISRSELAI